MMRSLAFLIIAVGVTTGPGAGEPGLPAPFQVEAIRVVSETPRVVVDLGKAEGRERPARESIGQVTLLGTQGFMSAGLEQIVKICNYLCGDEIEECHYGRILRPVGAAGVAGFCTGGHSWRVCTRLVCSDRAATGSFRGTPPLDR